MLELVKQALEILKELREVIVQYGLAGVLLIVLVLIIQDPDRAVKLKALFFLPVYRLFKWGSRQYLASEVGYTTTQLLNRDLTQLMPAVPAVRVKVKWVMSASDPVLSRDGTVVLRLEETDDQTRNILSAARVTLPSIVCPSLRPNLERYAASAVDLAILRKFADRLGRHARPVFQRYFLDCETAESPRMASLFAQLVELDASGTFVPVFLQELNALGEVVYATGDRSDRTGEILSFLEFLLVEARREVGEDIPLEHISSDLRVGIVLLAKSGTARTRGVSPYVLAVDVNVKRGCDSVYIVAYYHAFGLLKSLLGVLEGDDRVSIVKVNEVNVRLADGTRTKRRIALLRRNPLFADSTFTERVKASGLEEGAVVQGTVLSVSRDVAIVDVGGINGTISRRECSWETVESCEDVLEANDASEFVVLSIDEAKDRLALSRRLPEDDPWASEKVPHVGDVIEVDVVALRGGDYVGSYAAGIEVVIPKAEVSWLNEGGGSQRQLLDTTQRVVVYEKSVENRVLRGSVRGLVEDPWPDIHQRFAKGTEVRGTVLEVNEGSVIVELEDGITGVLPRDAMVRGGFEYADFQKTVVPGQGLDVVVSKVFIKRRWIRLDLRRNLGKTG